MSLPVRFSDRFTARYESLSPTEKIVAQFFLDNKEQVLVASAASMARQAGTSDATVVRTAKALGYQGLEDLRNNLAQEIRETISPASRMAQTISEVGNDINAAFNATLDINRAALEQLRTGISAERFQAVVKALADARRVFVFGIGPSGSMAEYMALGLARLGLTTKTLVQTGPLLADGIRDFAKGDILVIFAYGQLYPEVTVMLDQAELCHMPGVLVSDSLGPKLKSRITHVLPVARGQMNGLSMHTATLALIEALIVGVAIQQPEESLANLESLNRLRQALRSC